MHFILWLIAATVASCGKMAKDFIDFMVDPDSAKPKTPLLEDQPTYPRITCPTCKEEGQIITTRGRPKTIGNLPE